MCLSGLWECSGEAGLDDHVVPLLGGHSLPALISQLRDEVLTSGVFLSGEVISSLGSLLVSDVTCKCRAFSWSRSNLLSNCVFPQWLIKMKACSSLTYIYGWFKKRKAYLQQIKNTNTALKCCP